MLHYLRKEILQLSTNILSDFIKLDVVRANNLYLLDVDSVQLHVLLDKIYLGNNATNTLLECEDPEASMRMRKACLGFMTELVEQIRACFNVNDPILKASEILLPVNTTQCNPPPLKKVFYIMSYLKDMIDMQSADLEWRQQALD